MNIQASRELFNQAQVKIFFVDLHQELPAELRALPLEWPLKHKEQKVLQLVQDGALQTSIICAVDSKLELTVYQKSGLIGDVLRKSAVTGKSLGLSFNINLDLSLLVKSVPLSFYTFDLYKSEKKSNQPLSIALDLENSAENLAAIHEGATLAAAVIMARDLVNEPANILTPIHLAERAVSAGQEFGFEVEVLDEQQIQKLGMEAYWSVAKASINPPRFIIMRHFGNPDNKDEVFGLVGKGLTYDSGGLSIKPTESMVSMKCDMGGSAAVIAAMTVFSRLKLKKNVVAIVAACENLISGNGYRPGDIIGSMAQKTIEVVNTDAEGRLTLADAVYYAATKERVCKIVDLATLTGAVLGALGTEIAGIVGNNAELMALTKEAALLSGERVWELPATDDFKELNKSDVADLKNSGGKFAGSSTAGLFIGEFVDGKPWIHLDIAGTAWSDKDKETVAKGGTGYGVSLLYELFKKL